MAIIPSVLFEKSFLDFIVTVGGVIISCPHFTQNFVPTFISLPHDLQNIAILLVQAHHSFRKTFVRWKYAHRTTSSNFDEQHYLEGRFSLLPPPLLFHYMIEAEISRLELEENLDPERQNTSFEVLRPILRGRPDLNRQPLA